MIPKHKCLKCGYEWPQLIKSPVKCPNCQSRKWGHGVVEPVITKDEIDDFVAATVETLRELGLTPNEIRTLFVAKLKEKQKP